MRYLIALLLIISFSAFGQSSNKPLSNTNTIVVETSATVEEVLDELYYAFRQERIRIEYQDDISLETEPVDFRSLGVLYTVEFAVFIKDDIVELSGTVDMGRYGKKDLFPVQKKPWKFMEQIATKVPSQTNVLYTER